MLPPRITSPPSSLPKNKIPSGNTPLLTQLCSSQITASIKKKKRGITTGVIPLFLVEAAGLEPTVSSTRNWRDTTFATPRKSRVNLGVKMNEKTVKKDVIFSIKKTPENQLKIKQK